jgi:TRAP-type C4-dicarboxylate transport system substrate-binding protein
MVGTGRMIVLVAAVGFVLGGCGGSTSDKAGGQPSRKPVVLTLADPLSDPSEVVGFAREVSRLSGGAIKIDVTSRWRYRQVAYETGVINDVRAGRADLGVAGSRAFDSVGVNTLDALVAPMLINSYALQERVVQSRLIGPMLNGLAPLGLVGLGVLPGPLRRPLGLARPLLRPSDYAGSRIGVQQSRVGSSTMRALGAIPVWFAVAAPITGLGGIEQQISSIQGNQYDRVGHYLTANVVLWPRPLVVFANRKALAKLTAAERRILSQAVADDVSAQTRFLLAAESESTGNLCRARRLRFLTARPSDLEALRRTVQPVYATLERNPQTRADITQILALRSRIPSEVPPSCAPASTGVTVRSPLDGVWEMNTKYGDEPADPTPVAENYGHWIFVFDNGRFADTQEYLNACTWGYGTFTVKGDQMAWTFTDGGGIEPNDAANKPGEFFRFGWSLYRDTLTVTPVPGATSPTNFYGKPWHRVSIVPSARYLNRRCPPPANALPH